MPHTAIDIARTIEFALARQSSAMVDAFRRVDPASPACLVPLGGHALATFFLPRHPLGRIHALGLDPDDPAPQFPEALDHAADFYHARAAEARIDLCPLAAPALVEALASRGFRLSSFLNVFSASRTDLSTSLDHPPAISVSPVEPDQLEAWADTIGRGFHQGEPAPGHLLDISRAALRCEHAAGFLARLDAKPAGGGALSLFSLPDARVAILFGGSTLPWARRRGVQAALLSARIRHALDHGADLLVVQSTPGTDSERNILRAGFSLAYTKPVLTLTPP